MTSLLDKHVIITHVYYAFVYNMVLCKFGGDVSLFLPFAEIEFNALVGGKSKVL